MPVNLLQQATAYVPPATNGGVVQNTLQNTVNAINQYWQGNAPSSVSDDMLYIQQLTAKSENLMWITGGNGTQGITGFIDSSQTFGASATWDNQVVGADTANTVGSMANNISQAIGSNKSLRMARNSMVTWQSSSFNAVSFSAFVLASEINPNPLEVANRVWDYVLPGHYALPGVMTAPGGYTMGLWDTQDNTISMYIGDWFEAKNAWVVSSATIEVSKERVKGTTHPLWVKIDMVCNPAREFFAEEVKGFFKGA